MTVPDRSALRPSPELNHRGVNGTHWRQIDEATYNACLDPTDYRPKRTGP